jgi:hypothetical protein
MQTGFLRHPVWDSHPIACVPLMQQAAIYNADRRIVIAVLGLPQQSALIVN